MKKKRRSMSGPILELSAGMRSSVRPEAALIQVKEMLGEGLSSRVFAALREDSRGFSRQDIVLKILKTETDISWMKREFDVLSQVRSPHCVRILGWENLPEGPALVLEHIRGITLLELASDRDLSRSEQDEIIAQIQEGLKAVHAAGLYHGDLSPGNVMIDREGCVRLIDFALISAGTGRITGTPPYISPEIWRGSAPGPSGDLFGLGLIREDLKTWFCDAPSETAECRLRAEVALGKNTLLDVEPLARAFLPLRCSPQIQEQLASRVRTRLIEREKRRFVTQALPVHKTLDPVVRNSTRFKIIWRPSIRKACAAGLCALVLAAPTFSTETVDASTVAGPPPVGGTLEVRTLKWTEVDIDGRPLGYAPVVVGNLAPGEYTLHWRGSRRSGDLRIQVLPGARILITDRDLMDREDRKSPGKD